MTPYKKPAVTRAHVARMVGLCVVAALLIAHQVKVMATDLTTSPLQTSTSRLVKPNIFYVLDDSGSMKWDFLPDWVNQGGLAASGGDALVRNSAFNGVYYDTSTTYTPPQNYDGSSYANMSSGNTAAWTAVPYDGFGVQTAAKQYNDYAAGNSTASNAQSSLLTTKTAGVTQSLVGKAYYYTFIPGEYCTALNLKTCTAQTTATATYPYPARVRWCDSAALTNCQASRIESGTSTFTNPRVPGGTLTAAVGATSSLTVGSASSGAVNGITVNGQQIMSAGTATNSSASTLAIAITNAINACTTAATGACQTAGYSATRSGSSVTINAPNALGSITYPINVNTSGSKTVSTSSFSGGVNGVYVPGSNVLTTIAPATSSYPYPGTTAKAKSRTDCAGTTCTYLEEMTNYANWWAYYRTRMQMTKSAASLAFSVLDSGYRLGYMSINNNNGSTPDFLNVADLTTGPSGQKQQWYKKFTAALPSNGTGLRIALASAGQMYAGKLTGSQQLWANESSGDTTSVTVTDPMQYACQRNYTIVSTDGYWNDASNPTKIDGATAIGDVDGADPLPFLDANKTTNTLADVADYYYKTDIRSSTFNNTNGALSTDVANNNVADGQQRMITSTVGLGASGYMLYQSNYATAKIGDYFDVLKGTATSTTTQANGVCSWQSSGSCNWPVPVTNTQTTIDDLWHAAVNGRGTYYSASNPSALKNGLSNFLQNVSAATGNAAAATTSNPNITTGDNFVFQSTFHSVDWYGELARYQLDLLTGVQSVNADWSQSGTVYANAASKTQTSPLLDNRLYTQRQIYTYDPATAGSSLVAFNWSSLSPSIQNMFKIGAIGSLSQMCASGTTCLDPTAQIDSTTAGAATGAGGINLVNFIRGDRSNEGPDSTSYYRQRTHVLGDIVNSQAVYIKAPMYNYSDTGYSTYKANNAARQGAVYVGANDGMLHAFNSDNGAELWAYIPSMLLPNLYKLADKNYNSKHTPYVNATPQQSDAYFDGAWHTILVSGLGRGGQGFFALDVTSPTSPSVLWEFTSDTSKNASYIKDADLGYSYGTPVITKLSDGTWAVIVTSGYNNNEVAGASGHGMVWVLNAKTGAIIKKIDTGAGSSTAPAGLARILGYSETASTNNTAPAIYGGDLLGNVWRIDISVLTAAGGSAPVQLLATLKDASNTAQPVTSRPQLGKVGKHRVVFVGTGEYLGVSDISTTGVQSLYAIKDTDTSYGSPRANTCNATTISSCFVQQAYTDSGGTRIATSTVSYGVNFDTMNGWYVDLPESGERANTDPALQLGTLVFTTNVPDTSSACSAGGSSYITMVNYKTGLAVSVPGVSDVGGLLSYAGLTGTASDPTIVHLPNGTTVVIVNLSNGSTVVRKVPVAAPNLGTRRISWRELMTGQ